MKNNVELFEQLSERHFSREITPAEAANLKQLLDNQPELAEEFQFRQRAAASVIAHERNKLKAMLQAREGSTTVSAMTAEVIQKPNKGWGTWTKSVLAIAAALALVLVAVPSVRQQLFGGGEAQMAFVPYINEFKSAGGPDTNQALEQASNAYQSGDFAQAAKLFGQLDQTNPAFVFLKGVALAGSQQYVQALDVLNPITQSTAEEYAAPAWYYIAFCHHKLGQKPEAKAAAAKFLQYPERRGQEELRKTAAGL